MRIEGQWATRRVTVDGRDLSPAKSQRVWNHSPDGFNWGYGGSGPAQLALAILLHAGVHEERAVEYHQAFKWAVIAPLPQRDFAIDVNVLVWLLDRVHDAEAAS
jgi:hypothetical protein